MKLNKARYLETYEYDLSVGFELQSEFDSLIDFEDHAYTVYCDSYEEQQDNWS